MRPGTLKCVIWDLDETLWDGTLVEGDDVAIRPEARDLIARLEAAGVVQSVVSKNDRDPAMQVLDSVGLARIFVHPQISWSAKSASVGQIVGLLDIAAATVVFIDDSAFERAEVQSRLPEVACFSLPSFLASAGLCALLAEPVTSDGARRAQAYRDEARRRSGEAAFRGTPEAFLASLAMSLIVRRMQPRDIGRAVELALRTTQLNTTGCRPSAEQLADMSEDEESLVLVAELSDRFGDYGTIGLCIMTRAAEAWCAELFLLSCRAAGRNAGRGFLGAVGAIAAAEGRGLQARFRPNERNRRMQITLAFAGFSPTARDEGEMLYTHADPGRIGRPPYMTVVNLAGSGSLLHLHPAAT